MSKHLMLTDDDGNLCGAVINGTSIRHRSGSEGPRHDPYHYDEWTVTRTTGVATIHMGGLLFWVQINDEKSETVDDFGEAVLMARFERFAGTSIKNVIKAYDYYHSMCKTCRKITPTDTVSGYPGETFEVCCICGDIVDSHFNRSAVE